MSDKEQLEWLWANCKIVYWPRNDGYPIEHNPYAKKYARNLIEQEMECESPPSKKPSPENR